MGWAQLVTGCLGLGLVVLWGSALRGEGREWGLIAIFPRFFAGIGNSFISAGGLGAGLSFWGV